MTLVPAVTIEQIDDVRSAAMERNGHYPGMTYEEGVEAALAWVVGDSSQSPLEED